MIPITWSLTEPPVDAAIRFTYWAEGGSSNRKGDAGGLTGVGGVTQKAYNGWRKRRGLTQQSVLLCTADERRQLAIDEYWNPGHCGELPVRTAIAHFDWCYNHGEDSSSAMLQTIVGATPDGNIGPKTLALVRAWDDKELAMAYITARRDWYIYKADHDQIYGAPNRNGWLNRCDNLIKYLA